LLDRARKGDERAFAVLFERHQRAIYRYAVHMCGRDAGDDIVQETFLAVLQQGDRTDLPRGPVIGYLLGIARHRIWKRLAASPPVVEPLEDGRTVVDLAAEDLGVLEVLTRAELVAAVREAVDALPAAYREAVVLCELEEMSYAAAADVIACPIGTVRSRLHRGRALLLKSLQTTLPIEAVGKGTK